MLLVHNQRDLLVRAVGKRVLSMLLFLLPFSHTQRGTSCSPSAPIGTKLRQHHCGTSRDPPVQALSLDAGSRVHHCIPCLLGIHTDLVMQNWDDMCQLWDLATQRSSSASRASTVSSCPRPLRAATPPATLCIKCCLRSTASQRCSAASRGCCRAARLQ